MIDGKRYTRDIIIFQDRVLDGWYRREGHNLHIEDLKEILDTKPQTEVLIVGTGYSGLMKVSNEVKEILNSLKIDLISKPTKQACKTFNEFVKSNRRVIAAFHLTC